MTILRFVPAGVIGAGLLLISGMREQYSVPPRSPMRTAPAELAGLGGKDVEIAAEERRVAGMSDYVMRTYGPDSQPAFTLYVGYYDRQVQGSSIHSPKNCLPGAGWEIIDSKRVPLPGGGPGQTMNRVVLANKGVRALVAYWYQGRGRVESSEYRVKWNLLRDAALFGRTEEALVRLVVPLGNVAMGPKATVRLDEADALVARVALTVSAAVSERMPAGPGAGG